MANTAVYVTHEGLKKLEEELEFLRTVKRQEVAQRLHEAMEDGELIENAEYEAAKNEQAFVEGRILELEHMLAQAQLIEPAKSTGVVRIGSTVVIQEDGQSAETYTIVGAAEANPREGLISNGPGPAGAQGGRRHRSPGARRRTPLPDRQDQVDRPSFDAPRARTGARGVFVYTTRGVHE
jgi:transcription elongation factor GreA